MKLIVQKGKTSFLACIFIQDSSSTVGAGLSGLAFNTSGLVCYRARADDGNAGGTAVSLATATLGTWATAGFKEKDATNMKGVYEIGITNASLATGSDYCILYFSGATNMAPLVLEIQLVAFDPDDSVRAGLTGLANATPGAAGGLFIAGTNAATTITSAGGDALTLSSTGTNGNGLNVSGNGSGHAFKMTGGATGNAMTLIGGGTSGDGLNVTTTSGHGFNIAATGSSKHGITSTGGNAGTSDGIKGVAGTGGVDIRGNLTGNITGTLSTCTTVTNQLTAAAIATGIWTDTTAGDFTTALSVGKSLMNGVALGTGLTVNSLTNLPSIPANWLTAAGINAGALNGKGDWMVSYTQPTGFLAATFPSGTIANQTNITGGTITTATNLTNAATAGDLTATMAATVKIQVVAALNTDTYAEPGQGTPAATATLATKISFLYKAWRNKTTQDATTYKLFNDGGGTVDHKATVSDDGTTFTRGQSATGP